MQKGSRTQVGQRKSSELRDHSNCKTRVQALSTETTPEFRKLDEGEKLPGELGARKITTIKLNPPNSCSTFS